MTWLTAFLAWLAALLAPVGPPDGQEAAKASAAVSVARASMEADDAKPGPTPGPKPPKPDVCPDCRGTGWIVHGDGHKTPCPCGAEPKAAKASPTPAAPAEAIPWR